LDYRPWTVTMKIERFEDIEAWKQGKELAKDIYAATGKGEFAKDYGLKDQTRRTAVSVMANIVHPVKYMRWTISRGRGFDANSDDEFVRFLRYALRSATEVQSHLYVAADQGYISKDEFTQLYDQATEVKKLISGFIRCLKARPWTMDYGLWTKNKEVQI